MRELGQQHPQVPPRPRQNRLRPRLADDIGAQQVPQGCVRRRPVGRKALPGEHPHTTAARVRRRLTHQPRLADTRLSGDEDHLPAAIRGRIDPAPQRGQVHLPPDHHRRHERHIKPVGHRPRPRPRNRHISLS